MKLLELFRPRQAAFAAEPLDPTMIPNHSACNCADILLGDHAAEVKAGLDSGGNRRQFHQNIAGKILDIMFNSPDRSEAKGILGKIKRTQPSPNPAEEWERHLLMHLDGAGITHRDLGFNDNELSSEYIEGRELAGQAARAAEPTDYDTTHCGTCASYLTHLQDQARKFHSAINKGAENLPESQKPYAEMSTKGLFNRLWHSWTNKEPIKDDDHPIVAQGNDILRAWNAHSEQQHGSSLDPYAHLRNTPVVDDSTGNRFDNLYRKFEGMSPGWSLTRRPDAPEMSETTRQDLESLFPYQDVYQEGYSKDITPEERTEARGLADVMKQEGEMQEYTLHGIGNAPKAIFPEGSMDPKAMEIAIVKDKPTGKEQEMLVEPRPIGYEEGNVNAPQRYIETENITGIQRGKNYQTQRKSLDTETTYDPEHLTIDDRSGQSYGVKHNWLLKPVEYSTELEGRPEIKQTWTNHATEGTCDHCGKASCDGWHADDMTAIASIPREDAFLFQKAGIQPDLVAHKKYQKDVRAYKSQPTHYDTGKVETVTRPVTTIHPVKGIQPVLDEKGNPMHETFQVNVMQEIPAEQRLSEPSAEEAVGNYAKSYKQALETAYPGMSEEAARTALANEHQTETNRLESRRERYRTSSKKEDTMSKFNSSNNKEAHWSLPLIEPAIHAIQHGLHTVGDWAGRALHDMAHPITHPFTGDAHHLKDLQTTADQLKTIEPDGGMGRTIAEQNLYQYIDKNTGNSIDVPGALTDAALIAAPFAIKKRLSSFTDRYESDRVDQE